MIDEVNDFSRLNGYVIFWMKTLHFSFVSYLFGRVTAPVAWPLFAEQEFFDILRKALDVLPYLLVWKCK